MVKLKVRKGDKVIVLIGKDKGKVGKIEKVFPTKNKALVAGVNIVKRHSKPSRTSEGGVIQKESPIDISNLAHIDPKSGKPTKVGFKYLEDGTKIRFAKKSGEIIGVEGK